MHLYELVFPTDKIPVESAPCCEPEELLFLWCDDHFRFVSSRQHFAHFANIYMQIGLLKATFVHCIIKTTGHY